MILIDCGLSARQVELRCEQLDVDVGTLRGILLTHEHDDHLGGTAALARKFGIPVFLTAGTRRAAQNRLSSVPVMNEIRPGQDFALGPMTVTPVIVPHDAREPCQYVIESENHRLGLLTDLGHSTPHVRKHYSQLDGLLLEFNHEPELLQTSTYPASLQTRIASPLGHLSNQQAAALLAGIELGRLRCVAAAHLSEKTNSPELVEACLRSVLHSHTNWHIATQADASPWLALD